MARKVETDDRQSWFERGLELARVMREPLASASEAVSGRGLQREVAEYSEVLTQVTLGIYDDLQAARAAVRRLAVVAVLALLVALAALGVALWTLLS